MGASSSRLARVFFGCALAMLFATSALLGPTTAVASSGTHVSGIISVDTVWTPEGSPYYIDALSYDAALQIGPDATLTIQPGTRVERGTGSGSSIEVWGHLVARGTSGSPVGFDYVGLRPGRNAASPVLDFDHCRFNASAPSQNYRSGTISIQNSVVMNNSHEIQASRIVGNVFNGQACISLWGGETVANNVFYRASSCVLNCGAASTVSGNNFLDCFQGVVGICSAPAGGPIDATGNWWGTTDSVAIGGLIRDRSDDLSIPNLVSYVPFLSGPSPTAPAFESVPPTTTLVYGVPDSWVGHDVTLTAAAADNIGGSGVYASFFTTYTPYPSPWQTTPNAGSMVISEEGITKVRYWSEDMDGNVEGARVVEIRIDKSSPVSTVTVSGNTVRISASDTLSGTAHTYYRLDSGVQAEGTAIAASAGPHTLEFWSVDNAGNVELGHQLMQFVATLPKATVYTPVAPSTMYRGRSYSIYGYVAPRHTSGTYLVTLKFYKRSSSGTYVFHNSVNARRYYYSTSKTKYKASVSLPHAGKWRVRAYHSCSKHAGSYSGYDYITVK